MSEEKKDLGDKAEDAFDASKEKAQDLGGKAEDALGSAKEKASELADEAKDLGNKAEETFDSAKEKASEFAGEAKEKASEFAEGAKEKASEFTEGAKKTANEFSEGFNNVLGSGENKKVLVGILAILLGQLGIHKFLLGYQKEGFIMLGATIVGYITACFVIGSFIVMGVAVVGLIEGIIYLTKSDEEFYNTYQVGKKPWF